jgi:hypothetical protein
LLESLPDLFREHVLSKLEPWDRALLARVCKKTCAAVLHARLLNWAAFCNWATDEGHLEVAQWSIENGCKFAELAAYSGDLRILQFLREHDCAWDSRVLDIAARYEHVKLLLWARANGCPDPAEYYCGEGTTIEEYCAFLIRIGVPAAELSHLQAVADNSSYEWCPELFDLCLEFNYE